LKEFGKKFVFRNFRSQRSYCFYQWDDLNYEAFMLRIFDTLEPYHNPSGLRIQRELEDCNQIIFVMKGNYKIGFKVNEQEYYCLKFTKDKLKEDEEEKEKKDKDNERIIPGSMIGTYECFFNMRSSMIYKATTDISGFFIRKAHISSLFNDFEEFMV